MGNEGALQVVLYIGLYPTIFLLHGSGVVRFTRAIKVTFSNMTSSAGLMMLSPRFDFQRGFDMAESYYHVKNDHLTFPSSFHKRGCKK